MKIIVDLSLTSSVLGILNPTPHPLILSSFHPTPSDSNSHLCSITIYHLTQLLPRILVLNSTPIIMVSWPVENQLKLLVAVIEANDNITHDWLAISNVMDATAGGGFTPEAVR